MRQAVYETIPYFKNIPCKVEDIQEGSVRLSMDIAEKFCNYRGIASGGILAAFCDTIMGMSSRTLGFQVTTMEINMNYLSRVTVGRRVTGIGRVVHKGNRTIVAECEVSDQEGHIVAKGRSSFYILDTLDDDN